MKTLRRFLILNILLLLASQLSFARNVLLAQARSISDPLNSLTLSRPRASVPDDVYWDDRFAPLGVNDFVYAIAVSGSDVYVGGNFTGAGGVLANGIAKWDGSNWSALGSGVLNNQGETGYVTAIAVNGNDVYVGGNFASAGGVSANYIAKWNGSSWSALGSGINWGVNAIAVSGTDVYVGGHDIARWDGATWSAMGSGLEYRVGYGGVNAIATSGNDVYIGGRFTKVDGVDANGIAKWDGSAWSALGSGVNEEDTSISAIAVNGNTVYMGGGFSVTGGVIVSRIAKWDGASWSLLGTLIANDSTAVVRAMALNGNNVYVGGIFTVAGNVPASNIAKWDGNNWSALSSGVNYNVMAIALGGNAGESVVYVGGRFSIAGGVSAYSIATWNGNTWSALATTGNNGVRGVVSAIASSGNDVYVGGGFTTVGNINANNIAKWNGTTWSALGDGILGSSTTGFSVDAIAVSGNDVYAGGSFTTAGGVPANNIAKWNGSTWSALGNGVDGSVNAIAVSGTDIYAGGTFTVVSGISASRIAKWNGSIWSTLGTGLAGSNRGGLGPVVYAIAANGNDVYVGGVFYTAGNVNATHIAKWNGSNWSALGSGITDPYGWPYGSVETIVTAGNDVYAGGNFTTIGGISAKYIAKWNGTTWAPLGSGLDSIADALILRGNNLYVGGSFTAAGNVSANKIAQWNGCAWSALGSGADFPVLALTSNPSGVYAGGYFQIVGNKPSIAIARWSKPAAPPCYNYYFPSVLK